jgi:[ribosomal protein S18]-alanine N-acetyltransferase
MDALMLRTAEASDLAQLAALERAAFEMDRLSRRALQYSLTAATRRVLVITRGPRLLASVVECVRRDSRHLRIYSLAVDEAARGLGLGSMLLGAVEQIGRSMGRCSIRLEVRTDNAPARALYRRHAYIRFGCHSAFYQDGCDALRLHRKL